MPGGSWDALPTAECASRTREAKQVRYASGKPALESAAEREGHIQKVGIEGLSTAQVLDFAWIQASHGPKI